jgi:hypothetical protein
MVACQWNCRVVSMSVSSVSPAKAAQPQAGFAAQRVTYQVIADRASTARRGRITASTESAVGREVRRVDEWAAPVQAQVTPHPQAGMRADAAAAAGKTTYRPRSVSSLLMRLRAMVRCVLWGVGCGANERAD